MYQGMPINLIACSINCWADALADEVRPDRGHVEAVLRKQLFAELDVAGLRECLVDLEVVAPARELEAVEAPRGRLRGQLREREVGPLAREERDRARHRQTAVRTGTARPGAPSSEVVGS